MSEKVISDSTVLLSAVTTTGISTPFEVSSKRNVMLGVLGAATATGTLKFRVSFQETVNLTAAADADNIWVYGAFKDLNNTGTITGGDTGLAFTANKAHMIELNSNRIKWVAAEVSAHTSGTYTVKGYTCDNQ